MELNDLAFRFYESPIEKLFSEIRLSAFPRIEASESIAERLRKELDLAAKFCTKKWDDKNEIFYRARKNNYGQLNKFPPLKMGPPDAHIASAGRAQPAGVAVLYVADSESTAIAEVRPEVGEYVTTGEFRINSERALKVLDLTRFNRKLLKYSHREIDGLIKLSRHAFSAPAHPENPNKYYAHAYFVQMVRDIGYDGIGYASAVNINGRCFAFFDANNFICDKTSLHEVKSVSIVSKPLIFSMAEEKYIAQKMQKRKG